MNLWSSFPLCFSKCYWNDLAKSWVRRFISLHFYLSWGVCSYKTRVRQMMFHKLYYLLSWYSRKRNLFNYVYFHLCSQEVQHNCQLHRISFCADDKTDKRIFTFICKDSESNKHLCYVFDSEKCVSMPDVLGWFALLCKPGIVLFPALVKYLEMNKVCKYLTSQIDSSCHENMLQDFIPK